VIAKLLDAAAVLSASALLLIAAIGGVDIEAIGIRLHDWKRPAVVLALTLVSRAWLSRRLVASAAPSYVATWGMLALLIATVGVYAKYQVRVAGGLDSYGYVSASRLIATGRLTEEQPLASLLPFPDAMRAAAPLGHVPTADGQRSAPRFPLGLPIVMAVFNAVGSNGPFYVPLVMACFAIALAYLLARQTRSGGAPNHVAGLLAAVLIAVDPLFAAYAMQPMSDVPATCWLLAAIWLHTQQGGRPLFWCVAAGVSAGMAFLTRPALLPAIAVLLLTHRRENCTRPLVGVVAGFVGLQLALNWTLYGSFAASGYGPTTHMFELSASRLAANVSNFAKWLTYSHTPLFWLLWPGAMLVLRRERWAWHLSVVAAAAAAPYLFYIVFDDWESSRFLLPTITLITILSVRAVSHLRFGETGLSHLAMLVAALTCAAASHRFLEREGIYRLPTLEAKYALVGEWFKRNTSERVVVLAGLHSGPIRLYGNRATIRWDEIPEMSLAATLRSLISAGYEPYLALDLPSEPPLFEKRSFAQPISLEQVARVRVVNIYKFMSAY
jgi:hypothetical protein